MDSGSILVLSIISLLILYVIIKSAVKSVLKQQNRQFSLAQTAIIAEIAAANGVSKERINEILEAHEIQSIQFSI